MRHFPIAFDAPTSLPGAGTVPVPERRLGMIVALVAIVVIMALDAILGQGPQVTALLTGPPFIAAVFVGRSRTAVVGAISVTAAFVSGIADASPGDSAQVARLVGITVAAVGAVALASARQRDQSRMIAMTHIAEVAQHAVLRPMPARTGPASVAVGYISATAGARIGGDFYEALPVGAGLRAIVGDVRGKGLGAVQLASLLIGAFRGADHDHVDLAVIARTMDAAFRRIGPDDEDFATAVMIELTDEGDLTVVNCGHPAPLLVAGGDEVIELRPPQPAPPIGLGPEPKMGRHRMARGDRLLLFTDGMIEARCGGRPFDLDGQASTLRHGTVDEALEALRTALVGFCGGGLEDDVALLLLERD